MKNLSIVVLALFALVGSTRSEAAISSNISTLENRLDLPALPAGSNVNDDFTKVLEVGAVVNNDTEAAVLQVEAYVEGLAYSSSSMVCKLSPASFVGRPIDASQRTIEFSLTSPQNQGVNPQAIYAPYSVHRSLQAKITPKVHGAFYVLSCRRQLDNTPVSITYASLKVTAVTRD